MTDHVEMIEVELSGEFGGAEGGGEPDSQGVVSGEAVDQLSSTVSLQRHTN